MTHLFRTIRRGDQSARRGFSLIELLVVITLLGALTGVGYRLLIAMRSQHDRSESAATLSMRVDTISRLLASDLRAARAVTIDGASLTIGNDAGTRYRVEETEASLVLVRDNDHLDQRFPLPAGTVAWTTAGDLLTWSYTPGHDDRPVVAAIPWQVVLPIGTDAKAAP